MIVSELGLSPTALQDEIAIITGAGGGIGYEAVRSPLWLGTNVIIAEIYKTGGERPARLLTDEFGALEHHHVMDKKPYAFRWTFQAIIMV